MDLFEESKESLEVSDSEEVFFNIVVVVYEGRDFVWLDTPTKVQVKFGVEKKLSAIHPPAKHPYYNEYFVFDFAGMLSQLMDMPLSIKILSSRAGFMSKGLLASSRFDMATIWFQPNHFIPRKLVKLSHPDDPRGQVKGLVLCDLGILSPGVPSPLPKLPLGKTARSIELGELFSAEAIGGGKLLAKYCIQIHRAVGLAVDPPVVTSVEQARSVSRRRKIKVRVYFAGLSGETWARGVAKDAIWNEQLTFTEVFPPMYSRMRIDLILNKKTFCSRYVNLFKISDSNIKGFLPTYGPTFLHMYCPIYNYFGSLLLSVKTETVPGYAHKKKLVSVTKDPIGSLQENNFWNTEEFVVFAMLNSLSTLNRKVSSRNKFVLTMSLGDNERHPYDRIYNHFLTRPFAAEPMPFDYGYRLKDNNQKMTFFVRRIMPDTRNRLFVSNSLAYIAQAFAQEIDKSYALSEHDGPKASAILLNAVSDFMKETSMVLSKEALAHTELQRERLKVIKQTEAQNAFEQDHYKSAHLNFQLKIAVKHCKQVGKLVEDPQDNFPLLLFKLYAKVSKKVVAYCRVPLREIVFSSEPSEKGRFCSVLQTLFFQNVVAGQGDFGRMEVYLWFGLYKSVGFALQGLPPGYEDISDKMILPKSICYNTRNVFTFRAHIYQGFFHSCEDTDDSLCNSYVQIFVGNRVGRTEIIPKSVSPQWRATLTVDTVKIYGELSYLRLNPPNLIIEVYHLGLKGIRILYGRFSTIPYVYVNEEEYKNYPPPLKWYKVTNKNVKVGEMLAMFEIFHSGVYEHHLSTYFKKNELGIPEIVEFIRPKMVLYRLEVIFWGVRVVPGTPRKNTTPIINPLVKLDFGNYSFSSDTIVNVYEFPNFGDRPHIKEIELPENILFHPPLIIRVYNVMSFGTHQYVGHFIVKNINDLKVKLHKKSLWFRAFSPDTSDLLQFNVRNYSSLDLKSNDSGVWPMVCSAEVDEGSSDSDDYDDDDDDDVHQPLIDEQSVEGPKPLRSTSQNRAAIKRGPFTLLKNMIRKRKIIFQTTFDEDGNMITTSALSEQNALYLSNKIDEDVKYFDWWTKYLESVEKLYIALQKEKLKGINLEDEAKKLSVSKTAKMLLKALTHSEDRKENVSTLWKVLKHALAIKCGRASPTITVGGKLVIDADVLLHTLSVGMWKTSKLIIFDTELEKVPFYEGFSDVVRTYPIKSDSSRKKNSSSSTVAFVKVGISFYRWDGGDYVTDYGRNAREGIYSPLPSLFLRKIPLIVRIYIIRAFRLSLIDDPHLDPYIVIITPNNTVSDRERPVRNEINPIFGRLFEIKATLPFDSSVTIRIMDWDKGKTDDLIGDTTIDIENRFFSKHRGSVGLPEQYNSKGYNKWRDIYKPSEILESLCESNNLPLPEYTVNAVMIGKQRFVGMRTDEDAKECSALTALNNWNMIPIVGCHLVREHVETRSLYRDSCPGVEQGKLEMWMDLIPDLETAGYQIPLPVNITPREPEEYELRVIVWQTKKVMKKDSSMFIGSRHVDIFVAGWMEGGKDRQQTDVHYGSKNGHGLFNWRFIFNFNYYRAEQMIISKDRFEEGRNMKKVPPIVYFQIYDKERFRADDPLGDIAIDLQNIPRPEVTLFGADLSVLSYLMGRKVDLFKIRQVRGWFPATQYSKKGKGPLKTIGKMDLEFILMFKEEAIASPAGRGRDDPDPLPIPVRPKLKITVLSVVCMPCRRVLHYFWKYQKWHIIKLLLIVGTIWFLVLFVSNIPRRLVDHIFNRW